MKSEAKGSAHVLPRKNKNSLRVITLFMAIALQLLAVAVSSESNEELSIKSELVGDKYLFTKTFQTHSKYSKSFTEHVPSRKITLKWTIAEEQAKQWVEIPPAFKLNPANERQQIFDYSKMVQENRAQTRTLANALKKEMKNRNDFREFASLALAFVQDIPYDVPPNYYEGKFINGQFNPVQIFINGYGDCDSKSLLYLSLLANFSRNGFAVLEVPDHVFVGVEMTPEGKEHYFQTREKDNKVRKFVVAEPAGPRRSRLGEAWSSYTSIQLFHFIK